MIAPIFSVCSSNPDVIAVLGSDPVRLYPFGMQDDEIVYPYAVWQNISGGAEMYLDTTPDYDSYTTQIDVYADTPVQALGVAMALRNAIETSAYISRWGAQGRDNVTKKYRYSFDVDWIVKR
ncbi:tail completion protein gp17 [Entomohabitans teleogrylli]|uniref:tail completion protein gp17 n=1 Tax=Entomohabitans teleogrylli TaxID=1384589 RepID=UPI00073DA1C8|nr:DUF3168 domain-containing protein [Entomohabitans teleogrylli]